MLAQSIWLKNFNVEQQEKHNIIDKEIEYKIKHRQEYNYKCLDKLKELIEKYPDWRFTQIIFNVGLAEDRFYEEPNETLKTLENLNI